MPEYDPRAEPPRQPMPPPPRELSVTVLPVRDVCAEYHGLIGVVSAGPFARATRGCVPVRTNPYVDVTFVEDALFKERDAARGVPGLCRTLKLRTAHLRVLRCPRNTDASDISGCGSVRVVGPDDEGLMDCLNCGIWFPRGDQDELQPCAMAHCRERCTDGEWEGPDDSGLVSCYKCGDVFVAAPPGKPGEGAAK